MNGTRYSETPGIDSPRSDVAAKLYRASKGATRSLRAFRALRHLSLHLHMARDVPATTIPAILASFHALGLDEPRLRAEARLPAQLDGGVLVPDVVRRRYGLARIVIVLANVQALDANGATRVASSLTIR
jgi:hypothetical protein